MKTDHKKAFEIWLKSNSGFYTAFVMMAYDIALQQDKISAKYIVECIRHKKKQSIPNALTAYLWRHVEETVPYLKGRFTRPEDGLNRKIK